MTFTEAQEAARSAFAQTRTPGLDAVAGVLQRVVTNEQNRLAAEVAKVEGRCTDLENKTKRLESELAVLRAQADKLAAALGDSVYGLDTLIQTCDGKFPSGSFEQGTINSMKMSLIFSKNALADWGKGE